MPEPAPVMLKMESAPLGSELVPLCEPDDVARVLQLDETPDEPWAEVQIEAASSWARRYLRRPDLGIVGTITETFYDMRGDGFIPTQGTPTKVSVAWAPESTPEDLNGTAWTYDGEGVRLRPGSDYWLDENGGRRIPWGNAPARYMRIVVTETLPVEIDPLIREGVAIAAAALLTRAPRAAKGMIGEKIGDYSYTLAKALQGDPFFEEAKSVLRSFRILGPLVP